MLEFIIKYNYPDSPLITRMVSIHADVYFRAIEKMKEKYSGAIFLSVFVDMQLSNVQMNGFKDV